MKQKDVTTFTVATTGSVIGWDVLTENGELPTLKEALVILEEMLSDFGVEKYIKYAMHIYQPIDIIISNEDGFEHSLEYDPFSGNDAECTQYYEPLELFTRMLGVCLSEFSRKVNGDGEEAKG